MRLLGQLEQGVYVDDLEDVPLEDLEAYYGVHGVPRRRRQGISGAGHASDEDSSDDEPDIPQTDRDVSTNVLEGPNVPESHNPFPDPYSEGLFFEALRRVLLDEAIPAGYNIHPNEWEPEGYPTIEVIRSGRRGRREITVGLADEIWRPRAIRWVQAVNLLTRIFDAAAL